VFALYSIHHEFEHLIPDTTELMYTFLIAESDSTCKRNPFVFLAHCSMTKAVECILSIYDTIPALDEGLQMSIIEAIRLDCKNDSGHRVSIFL
jgi:coatomer subunit beta